MTENGRKHTQDRYLHGFNVERFACPSIGIKHNPLITNLDLTLDPSVQPSHSLEVSTFLRKGLLWNTQVCANCKSVLSVGVQARLVSLVALKEDRLDIASVRRRAALVQISECNADGRSNGIPFCGLRIGRVSGEAGVNTLALCKVASDVLAAKAVSYRTDLGDVVGGADRVEGGVDNRFDISKGVTLLPVRETVVGGRIRQCIGWDRVAAEQVRHDDEIAGFGDAVGKAVDC
jgi:hypothetical protein